MYNHQAELARPDLDLEAFRSIPGPPCGQQWSFRQPHLQTQEDDNRSSEDRASGGHGVIVPVDIMSCITESAHLGPCAGQSTVYVNVFHDVEEYS